MPEQAQHTPQFRVQRRVRQKCEICGEDATKCLTFLLEGDRRNPRSSAYGRDDCSHCSDAERFACDGCAERVRRERVDGMSWCGMYSCPTYEHMMFGWKPDEHLLPDLLAACKALVKWADMDQRIDIVWPATLREAVNSARAALAKAE